MEPNVNYHKEIFDEFVQHCPDWAKEAVDYRPKHLHAIRVTLRNGDQVDYNIRTRSYQYRSANRQMDKRPDDVTDMDCREIFAVNLSEIMNMRGVGQAILSERTGLSTAMISKYLNKKSTPSITNLKKIAHALDCHPNELIE